MSNTVDIAFENGRFPSFCWFNHRWTSVCLNVESLAFPLWLVRDKMSFVSNCSPFRAPVMHTAAARRFNWKGYAARSLTTNTRTLCQRSNATRDTCRGAT